MDNIETINSEADFFLEWAVVKFSSILAKAGKEDLLINTNLDFQGTIISFTSEGFEFTFDLEKGSKEEFENKLMEELEKYDRHD